MSYPLIIRVNSNANNPSTGEAAEVWVLELCGRHKPGSEPQKPHPAPPASLTQPHQGKGATCSDTVHGIRSPEAFLPRDRLFKMDWREISPSRHTCGGSRTVQKARSRKRAHSQNIINVLLQLP